LLSSKSGGVLGGDVTERDFVDQVGEDEGSIEASVNADDLYKQLSSATQLDRKGNGAGRTDSIDR
jgi:hypothetical protein